MKYILLTTMALMLAACSSVAVPDGPDRKGDDRSFERGLEFHHVWDGEFPTHPRPAK